MSVETAVRAASPRCLATALRLAPLRFFTRALTRIAPCLRVSVVMLLASPALAQTAPAGNAHPESAPVSEQAAALPNPFGDPVFDPTVAPPTLADKRDFAAALDLAPLRDLAVLHNGRVKILDTLARETVRQITGRTTYQDVIDEPGGDPARVAFEPLFTLLDLVIDPAFYVDRPLLHVEYLPLRRAFLDAALPGDEPAQQRYLMMTRITPRMAAEHYLEMVDRFGTQAPSRRGLDDLDRAMALWQESASNMLLVAPESRDASWHHVSEPLPPAMDATGAQAWQDARTAAADLGRAWRASDAAAANDAIARLAGALPSVNAGMYPDSRRSLELAYNRAGAFEWGWMLYFLSLIALVLAFGTGRRAVAGVGVALLIAAIGMHGFGFVARCVLAERFAIQNQFESMTGVSLFAAIVGLALTGLFRKHLYGAAGAATGFLVLIAATQTAIPGQFIEREAAILNTSVLLKYHVTTVLTSYGLITLGMVTSLFYLGAHYFGRGESPMAALAGGAVATSAGSGTDAAVGDGTTETGARQRLLKDLDKAQMIVLQLAFWSLGVGILLGAWWADHSWGRWWAFDPKETWALITWIIYLIVIHVRFTTGRNRALVTAWLSVVGFVMMLWTYFGVNLLLPGLHAYA